MWRSHNCLFMPAFVCSHPNHCAPCSTASTPTTPVTPLLDCTRVSMQQSHNCRVVPEGHFDSLPLPQCSIPPSLLYCYFPGHSLVRPSKGVLISVCLPPTNSSFIMLSYPSAHLLSTILMTLTIPHIEHLPTPPSPGTEYLPPLAIIQPPPSFVTSRSGSKQHHLVVHTPTQWISTQN
jgi:hypothetical protein